jgi:hypothetical protein
MAGLFRFAAGFVLNRIALILPFGRHSRRWFKPYLYQIEPIARQ